jgi:EmrB/QacA subfamily drug resistance transporter
MKEAHRKRRTATMSGSNPPPEAPALTPQQVKMAVGGVMLGMLLSALDQTVVSTALPQIVGDIGGLDGLSWVVTAYLLTSMAATPLWGKVSDLYGRRPVLQVAIVVFLLGSVLCGVAQNVTQLIAFRALQGVGAGALFVLALAVVADVVPPQDRGRSQGAFGGIFGLASISGPLIGGWLTDGPGWRWVFLVNLPVGLVALAATSVALKLPHTQRRHQLDLAGAVLIVGAVTSVLLYLNWAGNDYGWAAPGPLLLAGAALVLTVLFVLVERRAAEPVIPMTLFRNRVFSTSSLFGFLAGAVMFSGIVYLPLYLQTVQGMSATRSGFAMLPAMLGLMVTSIASGSLISKTGKFKIFPVSGMVVLLAAMLGLSQLAVDTPYWQIAIYAVLFGAGVGFTMQPVITAVQNAVEMKDVGVATSSVNFFQRMGSVVGVAVLGSVLAAGLGDQGNATSDSGAGGLQGLSGRAKDRVLELFASSLGDVFAACVPIVVLALVVALLIKEVPVRKAPEPDSVAADSAR